MSLWRKEQEQELQNALHVYVTVFPRNRSDNFMRERCGPAERLTDMTRLKYVFCC
jgi:hypothetical protein